MATVLNLMTTPGLVIWIFMSGISQAIDMHIELSNGLAAPNIVNAMENKEFVVNCVSGLGNQIVWRKNGDGSFQVYNTRLSFESIQVIHAGVYVCVHIGNNINSSVDVRVLYPPGLPSIAGPTAVIKSTSFSLTCYADSNPEPTYYWTYQPDHTAQVIARGHSFTDAIRPIYDSDFYVYCWVENTMFPTVDDSVRSAQSQKAVIKVLEPVYIWELFTEYRFNVSTDLLVYCRYTAIPDPTVYWTKDGDPDFRFDGDRLYIPDVQMDFTGYYSCHVTNTLRPSGQPETIATDVKHTLITIVDQGIPEECRDTCQRLVNEAAGNCGCATPCNDAGGCGNGVIAAAVVGWSVAGILLVVFLFCCIKRRDKRTTVVKNKGNDPSAGIELPPSAIFSNRLQTEEERLASRPVLPVRPDLNRKSDDNAYSYISGDDSRIDRRNMSGKYDYIGPDSNEPHDYLQLDPPIPESVNKEDRGIEGDDAKLSGVTNPINSSVHGSTDQPEVTIDTDDGGYLTSIKSNNENEIKI